MKECIVNVISSLSAELALFAHIANTVRQRTDPKAARLYSGVEVALAAGRSAVRLSDYPAGRKPS
jgi:hypothetical protein